MQYNYIYSVFSSDIGAKTDHSCYGFVPASCEPRARLSRTVCFCAVKVNQVSLVTLLFTTRGGGLFYKCCRHHILSSSFSLYMQEGLGLSHMCVVV